MLSKNSTFFTFQYIVYDFNACFGDIGGYLGLLLGQSLFGMYQALSTCRDYKKGIKGCLGLESGAWEMNKLDVTQVKSLH